MTLFKNCLNDFCILWYVYLWMNIILKNSIEPNIQFSLVCVEEAWGVVGWDRESPLQSKVEGLQFCFWPKGILLFFSVLFLFFFAFFFCEFLSWCSVGFVRINDHNIDSTSFIFFSLPVSFLYNLFIWVTLTPHIVAIIPLCIKHINNRIKVAILFPHILNSEYSIY